MRFGIVRRVYAALTACFALAGSLSATEAESDGKAMYDKWCGICHAPGPMRAGVIALQAKYQGSEPADLERRTDLSVALIKTFVRRGSGIMAPFRKTEISDSALDAISKYLTRPH